MEGALPPQRVREKLEIPLIAEQREGIVIELQRACNVTPLLRFARPIDESARFRLRHDAAWTVDPFMQCTSFVDDPGKKLLLGLTRTIDANPDTRNEDVAGERRAFDHRLRKNFGLIRRRTGQPAVVSASETRQRRDNQNGLAKDS
jgi:hypothetical protein